MNYMDSYQVLYIVSKLYVILYSFYKHDCKVIPRQSWQYFFIPQ